MNYVKIQNRLLITYSQFSKKILPQNIMDLFIKLESKVRIQKKCYVRPEIFWTKQQFFWTMQHISGTIQQFFWTPQKFLRMSEKIRQISSSFEIWDNSKKLRIENNWDPTLIWKKSIKMMPSSAKPKSFFSIIFAFSDFKNLSGKLGKLRKICVYVYVNSPS